MQNYPKIITASSSGFVIPTTSKRDAYDDEKTQLNCCAWWSAYTSFIGRYEESDVGSSFWISYVVPDLLQFHHCLRFKVCSIRQSLKSYWLTSILALECWARHMSRCANTHTQKHTQLRTHARTHIKHVHAHTIIKRITKNLLIYRRQVWQKFLLRLLWFMF